MPNSPAPSRPRSKSARPSSRRGRKAHSSLSHGLRSLIPVIPGVESEEDWLAHLAAVIQEISPVGHIETLCANHIALDFWRLKRIARYEILLVTHSDPTARPSADFGTAAAAPDSAVSSTTAEPDEVDEDDEQDDTQLDDDDDIPDRAEWERLEGEMPRH